MIHQLTLAAVLAASVQAADLPIREVILFKHGVGYFERAGQLKAGETAVLQFKGEEMNDVLKSLTVEDKSGTITGLRYDSSEPLERKLGNYSFGIAEAMPLATFLDQLKGARVQMKLATEFATGVILSGRVAEASEKQPEKELVVLLLDTGELRTIDLGAVLAVTFPDSTLQDQLKAYLTTLNQARSKEKRSVYIDATGSSAREVIASYMTPSAVWKSSYRLILSDAAESTLEGWAIVDNTSGEDWTNVKLALVSGRPISFISQLYDPRYRQRPAADLAEEASVAPQVFEGGIPAEPGLNRVAPPPPPAPVPNAFPKPAVGAGKMAGLSSKTDRFERTALASELRGQSSIASTAAGRELGELFEYRFESPVTVKRSESAMLPFLQQRVNTRKLLIYRDGGGQNPLNAAEIVNSSGKTLDGGPLTVYAAGAYAGEALMETLKTGDKRLISYAIDLGTRVTTAFDTTKDSVREVHFSRGVITTRSSLQELKTYTARNVDQKAKTLIIEHPQRDGYKLMGTLKASETTASMYRFEVKLGPGATTRFPVNEERLYDTTYEIDSLTPDLLGVFIRNKAITDAGRRSIQQILDLKQQIAAADSELEQIKTQVDETAKDQDRARQNMLSLNQVSGQQSQVQNYAQQLAAAEQRIASLRDRSAAVQTRKNKLETDLASLIDKMEF